MNETTSLNQDQNREDPEIWAFVQEVAQLMKRHSLPWSLIQTARAWL